MSAGRSLLAVLALLAATACESGDTQLLEGEPRSDLRPAAPSANPFSGIPEIVRKVEPSVVAVLTDAGEGSGVVWEASGRVVTNHHVVAGASRVELAFADGKRSPARVVAADEIPPQARAVSIGFAIPARTVTEVVTELVETGRATHPFFGIQPAPLTEEIARQLDVEADAGVLVLDVVPDGPAAGAGIVPGDVIVALDGDPIGSVEAFLARLRPRDPGEPVSVTIMRGSEERTVTVRLSGRPAGPASRGRRSREAPFLPARTRSRQPEGSRSAGRGDGPTVLGLRPLGLAPASPHRRPRPRRRWPPRREPRPPAPVSRPCGRSGEQLARRRPGPQARRGSRRSRSTALANLEAQFQALRYLAIDGTDTSPTRPRRG